MSEGVADLALEGDPIRGRCCDKAPDLPSAGKGLRGGNRRAYSTDEHFLTGPV